MFSKIDRSRLYGVKLELSGKRLFYQVNTGKELHSVVIDINCDCETHVYENIQSKKKLCACVRSVLYNILEKDSFEIDTYEERITPDKT